MKKQERLITSYKTHSVSASEEARDPASASDLAPNLHRIERMSSLETLTFEPLSSQEKQSWYVVYISPTHPCTKYHNIHLGQAISFVGGRCIKM